VFDRATQGYVKWSHGLIRKAFIGVAILVGFIAVDGIVGRKLPTSFIPEEDQGFLFLNAQLPAAASLERTDAVVKKIEGILAKTEGVKTFSTIVGFSLLTRVSSTYSAFLFVSLKPWDERKGAALEARGILRSLNRALAAQVPEATAFAFSPPAIPGFGNAGGFSMWLQDRSGASVESLDQNVKAFVEAARKRPELTGVNSVFTADIPQVYAEMDREKVLKQGIAVGDVYQTLQTYLGGLFVNQFNRFGRQWRVFLQAEGEDRLTEQDIAQYYVRNQRGNMVPLSALTSTRRVAGPEYTNRFNLYRAAQILGSAAPGYSSGQALAALEQVAAQVLPREMGYSFADLSYQEKKASGTAGAIFALSLGFVFLILAALYESWSLPFSVLLSVPVAVLGAFLGLYLRNFDLGIFAQIGLAMLIGLAAKNAILIVEFARDEIKKGRPLVEAALEGARLRLRPILMTSFAFIFGMIPLWVATGAGAISRQILGTVVITGMLAATAVAIFIIPLLFVLVERLANRRGRDQPAPRPAEPEVTQ
jgi:HAE1 family hydrophobic/amphiphilic exporter-1